MKNHILSALVANSIRGFNLSSTQKIAQEQKFEFFSKIEGVVDTRCEFFRKEYWVQEYSTEIIAFKYPYSDH